MKKFDKAQMCSRKSRLKIALQVKRHYGVLPQLVHIGFEDGSTKVMVFDVRSQKLFMPAWQNRRYSTKFPHLKHAFVEGRELTISEVNTLRSKGYDVQILSGVSCRVKAQAVTRGAQQTTNITSAANRALFNGMKLPIAMTLNLINGGQLVASAYLGHDNEEGDDNRNTKSIKHVSEASDDHKSEEKFLVSILVENERQREELQRLLQRSDAINAILRKRLDEIAKEGNTPPKKADTTKEVFKDGIQEHLMAEAMREVYDKTTGNGEEAMRRKRIIDPIDLMALLFIMVDIHNYGNDNFHNKGKRPFFIFFTTKVVPELNGKRGISRKTMSNRINTEFSCLYQTDTAKKKLPEGLRFNNMDIERDFYWICGIFHKTKLGTILHKHI